MKVGRFLLGLIVFVISMMEYVAAQQYNYVQYTTKDGLAGSTVYDACQDENGFIWFGTDNGLSRFDGKNFKNYTVEDGLPDNEVLVVSNDFKGRIWLGTFSKEICYWYNGKIYNKYNDSLVAKMNFRQSVNQVINMPDGIIYITDLQKIYQINKKDEVLDLDPFFPHSKLGKPLAIPGLFWFGNNVDVLIEDSLYFFDGGKFNFYKPFKIKSTDNFSYGKIISPGDTPIIKVPYDLIKNTVNFGTPILLSSTNGAWEIDTVLNQIKGQFLAGRAISKSIIGKEGVYWFCTVGEGVFKLTSKSSFTIPFPTTDGYFKEVFSIDKWRNKIYAGLGQSRMAIIVDGKVEKIKDFSSYLKFSPNNITTNRLKCMNAQSENYLYLGFDAFLVRYNSFNDFVQPITAIKSIERVENDQIMISSSGGVSMFDDYSLKFSNRIFSSRSTVSVYYKSSVYFGTLNGLYAVRPEGRVDFLGENQPLLQRRITDIVVYKDKVWVATNDKGLILLNEDKPAIVVNEKNGLCSNSCKTLFTDKSFLWVGTNNGLNKISLNKGNLGIQTFDDHDLLPSNIINTIFADSNEVWVGTPEGVTYFKTDATNALSDCNLYLEKINDENPSLISGQILPLELTYFDNRLEVSYVGISMKSGGDIRYHYILNGLDETWFSSNSQMIEYASIPPGKYTLSIYAENKFGIKSRMIEIPIIVSPAFWQTKWFYVLMGFIVILLLWMILFIRKKKLEKYYDNKNRIQQQFAELEQQALQSQMNPHFIFNCLNSIQQFVVSNKPDEANRFLSKFAILIRDTLENSTNKYISLKREMDYLERYLELERLRFGNSFAFHIQVSNNLEIGKTQIPVMLFQPFIENAIRHGVRNRPDTKGELDIQFLKEGDTLIGIIRDNGIGRENALKLRSGLHIEYQSRGIELTRKRAEIFNLSKENNIEFIISDANSDDTDFPGTQVIIKIKTPPNDKKDKNRSVG